MTRILIAAIAAFFMTVAAPDQIRAQTSCSAWKSTCFSRCAGKGPNCKANCEARANECKRTGCFYAAAEGKRYCNLKKN